MLLAMGSLSPFGTMTMSPTTESTAELSFALLITVYRRIAELDAAPIHKDVP